jgi:hypothetical protein
MSELEQRARERFEKWARNEGYDLVRAGKDSDTYYCFDSTHNANIAWEAGENSIVRSIISGMEERLNELNKTYKPPISIWTRAGKIAELEAQIAGLKKKFGVEGM